MPRITSWPRGPLKRHFLRKGSAMRILALDLAKNKSDRKDALKLAQLSEMENLPTVHVPKPAVRQWRSLIEYRHSLVARRTAIRNSIRSIYERQGLSLPARTSAWTQQARAELDKEV